MKGALRNFLSAPNQKEDSNWVLAELIHSHFREGNNVGTLWSPGESCKEEGKQREERGIQKEKGKLWGRVGGLPRGSQKKEVKVLGCREGRSR